MSRLKARYVQHPAAPSLPGRLLARSDRARWDAGRQPGADTCAIRELSELLVGHGQG